MRHSIRPAGGRRTLCSDSLKHTVREDDVWTWRRSSCSAASCQQSRMTFCMEAHKGQNCETQSPRVICSSEPELLWSLPASWARRPDRPPGWPSPPRPPLPSHRPPLHPPTQPETRRTGVSTCVQAVQRYVPDRVAYLLWRHSQLLQSAAEHGRLGDPVTWATGLEDQVKMAAQQREKAGWAVCSRAVIQPVIGQHGRQQPWWEENASSDFFWCVQDLISV